jgi:pimeloyl-ACP methyl ester carboxylesterase
MPQTIANTAKGSIEYRLEGSGPTVVVLNGGHCSRESRLSHERLTERGFSVLTPSRPGYDDTPPDVGKTAPEAADAVAPLLDTLQIPIADVIGISAAGPSALALAQRYPGKIRKLILESAVTTAWDTKIKRRAHLLFGRAESVTWGLIKLALRLTPMAVIRAVMQELTTLDIDEVIKRMSQDDLRFVRRMIETSRSGTGFMNDTEHQVNDLVGITVPVWVMYSPYDKAVPPKNAMRVAAEVARCELYEVPSDTHLRWIGKSANDVWQKRLSFLKSQARYAFLTSAGGSTTHCRRRCSAGAPQYA